MKKSRIIALISTIVFMSLVAVYMRLKETRDTSNTLEVKHVPTKQKALQPRPAQPLTAAQLAPAPLKKGNRSYYGSLPAQVTDIHDLRLVNQPSSQWQKKLELNLRRLGGEKLKTLEVLPQESYIIPEGDEGRLVERVIVKLEGKDGEYTSFFAEVDSESGHVIKTWGVAIPEKNRHRH